VDESWEGRQPTRASAPAVSDLWTYRATVNAVHDGDTLEVNVDLGFDVHEVVSVRLLGCNARELRDLGGVEARDNLRALLPPGAGALLRTVKPDKFGGRYDAAVEFINASGQVVDLVAYLIEEQWVAPWNGRGEKPVPPWPRTVTS